MAVITLAGEQLIARKQQAKQPLVIREFVLAHVPNLDPKTPPRRDQSLPTSRQIVFRSAPTRSACVNGNEVVYSLILDNTVGNFQFNWLGLVSEEGVLISANHMVVQSKRKSQERTGEEGNNLTRNFLLKFSGAQAISNITVTPETWQFNYEAKLDEMEELELALVSGMVSSQVHIVEMAHKEMVSSQQLSLLSERVAVNEQGNKHLMTDCVDLVRRIGGLEQNDPLIALLVSASLSGSGERISQMRSNLELIDKVRSLEERDV
ncbi:phage tail protein [Vibrio sp. nBUS_14]|uniref:phage tail-collar fiber domain-containing protein n=1 Tax=Vibrio sp. nBUS_14 TaxID=3395321 RepID=UPI003EBB55E8